MPVQLVDDAGFQVVLSKLHAHAADSLRYRWPAPHDERMIRTLRLEPAAYLPGASLADVCAHFRQHHAQIIDREKEFDPEYEASLDPEKFGAKYNWCLVIDEEALQSIESAPEPIGLTPPEGVPLHRLLEQSSEAFVKLLSVSYTTMEGPELLGVSDRSGTGHRTEWNGWLKFSPTMLKNVWRETDSGNIETYFRDTDTLVEIP
jgi:hypothetical protein